MTVIVVIGEVMARVDQSGGVDPAGFAAIAALAAAERGAKVEVVTRLGDDLAGDGVLLAFARAGVGHVATLRDAGLRTRVVADTTEAFLADDGEEPEATDDQGSTGRSALDDADVALALRYLTDYRVVVVAHPTDTGIVHEAASAAGWANAHLVVVISAAASMTDMPDAALVLSADPDAEDTAQRVGVYSAALDAGAEPELAYGVLTAATT